MEKTTQTDITLLQQLEMQWLLNTETSMTDIAAVLTEKGYFKDEVAFRYFIADSLITAVLEKGAAFPIRYEQK